MTPEEMEETEKALWPEWPGKVEIKGEEPDVRLLNSQEWKEACAAGPMLRLQESFSPDMVNHPPHYTSHPSGVEAIQICEHMGFNVGNAIKYLWREGKKGERVKDLEKAEWYVKREIERVTGGKKMENSSEIDWRKQAIEWLEKLETQNRESGGDAVFPLSGLIYQLEGEIRYGKVEEKK